MTYALDLTDEITTARAPKGDGQYVITKDEALAILAAAGHSSVRIYIWGTHGPNRAHGSYQFDTYGGEIQEITMSLATTIPIRRA
jgi:hypothetical protein